MTERNLFGPDAPDNAIGIFVAPSLVAGVGFGEKNSAFPARTTLS